MNSIKSKLLVSYFILTLIPVIIMGIYTYRASSNSISNNLNNAVLSSLELVGRNIDTEMASIEKNFDYISMLKDLQIVINQYSESASQGAMRQVGVEMEKLFTSAFYREKGIASIVLFWSTNGVFAYKNNSYVSKQEWTTYDWYKKTDEFDGKFNSIGLIRNPDKQGDSQFVYIAGKVLKDTQDKGDFNKIGTIYILYDESIFTNVYSNVNVGSYGYIMITDSTGRILSHNDKNLLTIDASEYPYMKTVLNNSYGYFKSELGMEKLMVAYYTCPNSGYKVIQVMPYDIVTKEVSRIGYVTFLISLFCLSVVFLIAYFVAKGIAHPIRSLQAAMKKVEDGNFNASVFVHSHDEIGQMTVSFNYMVKRIKESFDKAISEEIKKKQIEIKALQYQINPHFLYNILASVRLTAMMEGGVQAPKMLQALRRLLSKTIGKSGMFIPISTEIENINDFVYIQQICYGGRLSFSYDISDSIQNYRIPNLLLQPIVENAIFHGIDKKVGVGEIKIIGYHESSNVIFKISDNGVGMSEELIKKVLEENCNRKDAFNQVGIKNTDDRIKLNFGKEYGIKINSSEGEGTTVTVTIPIIEDGSVLLDEKYINRG